jgi:hypothetical protein
LPAKEIPDVFRHKGPREVFVTAVTRLDAPCASRSHPSRFRYLRLKALERAVEDTDVMLGAFLTEINSKELLKGTSARRFISAVSSSDVTFSPN